MKKFKAIYYPILAVLTVLMLVLGFVASAVPYTSGKLEKGFESNVMTHLEKITEKSHSVMDNGAEDVRTYIDSQLRNAGVTKQYVLNQLEDDNYGHIIEPRFQTESVDGVNVPVPTFVQATDTLTRQTVNAINRTEDRTTVLVSRQVFNIVVAIPGEDSKAGKPADAVIMMAHYDALPDTAGANDNGVNVAVMLETIKTIVSEKKSFKNDLIFVFADSGEDGAYGAYAFRYQFRGFNDAYSRAKLGINFDGMGNGGALAMFSASDIKVVSAFNSEVGGAIADSAFSYVYGKTADADNFAVFEDIQALNFANAGNSNTDRTSLDDVASVSKSDIAAKAKLMNNLVSAFGDKNLTDMKKGDNGVYFSYLGFFNVAYSYKAAYVIGAIIIALLVAAIVLNVFKKSWSFARVGVGLGIHLLSVICASVAILAMYYIISLLLVGFGVMPFHAITRLHYYNAGFIVGAMIMTVAALAAFYYIFKRVFKIKAADMVRGAAALFAIVGAIFSFVMPQLGYLFAWMGMFEAFVFLMVTLFKNGFKQKFGMDMDRLFLYALPVIIIGIPLFTVLTGLMLKLLSTVYLCLLMAVFALMLGMIVPYVDFIIPALNRLVAKLPKRTIRVSRVVTEQVEDKAKKGKFTEQQVKKITKEKIEWKYRHGVGITVVTLIAVVIMILSVSFSAQFGTSYAGSYDFDDYIYKDSLVFVWEKDSSGVSENLEIRDQMAYKFMSRALDEFKWDAYKEAYVKDFGGNISSILPGEPSIVAESGTVTITPYGGAVNSRIMLRLTDASGIQSVSVFSADGTEFEVENYGNDVIEIYLPYKDDDYNSFRLEFEATSSSVNIEYVQYISGAENNALNSLKNNLAEWQTVRNYFRNNEKIYNLLRCGMILKYNTAVSI